VPPMEKDTRIECHVKIDGKTYSRAVSLKVEDPKISTRFRVEALFDAGRETVMKVLKLREQYQEK
jgi:hypothetical protein